MLRALICLVLLVGFEGYSVETDLSSPSPKKILVLSSKGGGGHAAAVNTLEKILGEGYQLQVVHPIDEMLRSSGISLGEKIYDVMLKNQWIRSLNFLARRVAPRFFRGHHKEIEESITAYIEQTNPDLVISVAPFINYPGSEAARKARVPYLLITTDNDLRNWAYGLEYVGHPRFMVTIGADLPTTRDVLLRKEIPDSAIQTIGLPLRPDFINYSYKKSLKELYEIPEDKTVILVMMGGSGSRNAYSYAERIGSADLSAHLVVCIGRHERLREELEEIDLHPSNSMTIVGFTDKVADLMALSDLIITKPGPGTINEAIAMRLPLFVDTTEISLFWERANTAMVKRFGIGQEVVSLRKICPILEEYLSSSEKQKAFEESFAMVPPNQFHEKIKGIVDQMIGSWDLADEVFVSKEPIITARNPHPFKRRGYPKYSMSGHLRHTVGRSR